MIIKNKKTKKKKPVEEEVVRQEENSQESQSNEVSGVELPVSEVKKESENSSEAEIDLFNLDNIDFKQRQERRRGDEVVREATAVLDARLSEIEKKTEHVQNTEAEIDPDAAADAARKIVSLVCSAGVFDVR